MNIYLWKHERKSVVVHANSEREAWEFLLIKDAGMWKKLQGDNPDPRALPQHRPTVISGGWTGVI